MESASANQNQAPSVTEFQRAILYHTVEVDDNRNSHHLKGHSYRSSLYKLFHNTRLMNNLSVAVSYNNEQTSQCFALRSPPRLPHRKKSKSLIILDVKNRESRKNIPVSEKGVLLNCSVVFGLKCRKCLVYFWVMRPWLGLM